uniref:Beta-hexosaminidase n=1 Tax=Trichobilharzia regenti TaxID=157069 RepID=A0AA85IQ01_TRIRE|nr:unnamed protein product [Trichobilharzia regenti]
MIKKQVQYSLIPQMKIISYRRKLCKVNGLLNFEYDYTSCYILEEAIKRFVSRLKTEHVPPGYLYSKNCSLSSVKIEITEGCSEKESNLWPSESMKESYSMQIRDDTINIRSEEIWGTLHALETLFQLVQKDISGHNEIYECNIDDSPRFFHRGVMIDTARHYLSTDTIRNLIDAMSMVKMNVLHWHMTDDESFPYDSSVYPELSSQGAYHPHEYVYERGEIDSLIEFARLRGIRVIVEFDTPGHTSSWGRSHPEILSGESHEGPINPASEDTRTILSNLFQEVVSVFPDKFLHLGGSVYDRQLWQEDAEIQEFMKQNGFDEDYNKLENYYFEMLAGIIENIGASAQSTITPIVWQSVFENGYRGNTNTVIHVQNESDWQNLVKSITSSGYRVINSACWSNLNEAVVTDTRKFYECDVSQFGGTDEEVEMVIGGEVIIWGTYVDDVNLFVESWPIIAAAAERLWYHYSADFTYFSDRLKDLHCRMRTFDWNVQPFNGPGYCPLYWLPLRETSNFL